MRKLTHYELRVLINNEVQNMARNSFESTNGLDVNYQKSRAEDILRYIAEYEQLETLTGETE